MSLADRFCGAFCVGFVAFSFARGIGLPAWSWDQLGDAGDVAMFSALAYGYLTRALLSKDTTR